MRSGTPLAKKAFTNVGYIRSQNPTIDSEEAWNRGPKQDYFGAQDKENGMNGTLKGQTLNSRMSDTQPEIVKLAGIVQMLVDENQMLRTEKSAREREWEGVLKGLLNTSGRSSELEVQNRQLSNQLNEVLIVVSSLQEQLKVKSSELELCISQKQKASENSNLYLTELQQERLKSQRLVEAKVLLEPKLETHLNRAVEAEKKAQVLEETLLIEKAASKILKEKLIKVEDDLSKLFLERYTGEEKLLRENKALEARIFDLEMRNNQLTTEMEIAKSKRIEEKRRESERKEQKKKAKEDLRKDREAVYGNKGNSYF